MSRSYAFLFAPSGLDVIKSQDGLENIVYSINYRIAAVGDFHQAFERVTTVLSAPVPDSFVEYEQITESQLVEWIEHSEARLDDIKADLAVKLEELEAMPDTVTMPLPWEIRS
jgi:hypothetical protein